MRFRPVLIVIGLSLVGSNPALAAEDFAFHHENVMGTSLELRVRADSAALAGRAEARALREIDRLSAIFSGYDRTSEFSRWQAAPRSPMKVSPELFELLRASESWHDRSGGAFDARAEVLSRLWSNGAKRGRVPSNDELAAATRLLAGPAWRLDPANRTAERLSDAPLSLNAIAKGYIVERACAAAMESDPGVRGLLLNVGGDLRASGEMMHEIDIANPLADSETSGPIAEIEIRNRAVATSGRSQRGFRIDGKWYSHILDPRTGKPADAIAGATVVAERSADADALATIVNVLPIDESLRLVQSIPGAECLLVATDGRVVRSRGWGAFENPRLLALAQDPPPKGKRGRPREESRNRKQPVDPKPLPKVEAPADWWGNEYEFLIKYEIDQPTGGRGRYRRPYVAIWVEDKDGKLVRNLILWVSFGGAGHERWLPDLRRWYKSEKGRKAQYEEDPTPPVARPTRPPGKYDVIWDGRDDHNRPLPAGEYVISIDVAREHGTYQNIRKPVTIGQAPFVEELKGNVELKSASIEYRRKAPAAK